MFGFLVLLAFLAIAFGVKYVTQKTQSVTI